MTTLQGMLVKAYAKINLSLVIRGKREDGFHELETILQSIALCDKLQVDISGGDIEISVDVPGVPRGRENIIFKAIEAWRERTGIRSGFRICVEKKIPVAAGLGGGSSDAAAVLKAVNCLFGNPLGEMEIYEIAKVLGSDVPFFLKGGTVFAWGRGEKITKLPFIGRIPVLLINPGIPVPTRFIYENLDMGLTTPCQTPKILPAFSEDAVTWEILLRLVHNDLHATVLRLYPKVREIVSWLRRQGVVPIVSGSGGTVFGLFEDAGRAKRVAVMASNIFPWAMLTETVDPELPEK